MERGEKKQHRCRICGKSFGCGRSLGGHMRSHAQFVSSDADQGKKPKKRRRLSDEALKLCEVCGKEFSSWKALYGHMRCHSHKNFRLCFKAEQDQQISSATEHEPEQEEVAVSLIMLSRGVGGCWNASAAESSDKQSVVLEAEEAEDSGDESGRRRSNRKGNESVKKTGGVDENGNGFNAFESKLGKDVLEMEGEYQCSTCNRAFHSYQALGGHRASHRRTRGCCPAKINGNDWSRLHECSICGMTFSSGQALGGHKRSHLVPNGDGGSRAHQSAEIQQQEVAAVLELDLNLPAPAGDEEELSNVKPWWAEESMKHEQTLVGLISN